MKTNYFKPFRNALLASIFILVIACSKDEYPVIESEPDPIIEQLSGELTTSNGIAKDDLEAHQGSLGIIVDARNIAKKGFLPVTAEIEIDALKNNQSKTLEIDEFTNLASLKFDVEDLTEAALKELKDGVPIIVDIKDKDGITLVKQEFSVVSFRENGTFVNVDANQLIAIEKPASFSPDTPYYLQLIIEGELSDKIITAYEEIDPDILYGGFTISSEYGVINSETQNALNQFFLIPVPDKESTYHIKNAIQDFYLRADYNGEYFYLSYDSELNEEHEFILENLESGNITIKDFQGKYVHRHEDMDSTWKDNKRIYAYDNETISYETEVAEFRIVPATIQWEVETLNAVFMNPILPAVETSFGFNSTLVNCSQGTLEQEVGTEISEQTTTTVGWEESIELSSESTYEVSATLSVSASVSFFGTGGEVSASATAGYSSTSGFTSSHSGFEENEETTSQTFFSSRTIEVLPGTAVLVYDAYQTYSNVLVPFVQRFRVRGSDTSRNTTLKGDNIVSQFSFNKFNGVITKVGSDYVEVTVRGTVTLDNLIDTQSQVQEVESNCN